MGYVMPSIPAASSVNPFIDSETTVTGFLIILSILLGLLAIAEWGLRFLFGFGNPLIYIPDSQIGYLLAPNQQTRRFGNRIQVNAYSMRSSAITPTCSKDTQRILLLGDSVANGGWWTDQPQTISALLTQQLQSRENAVSVEVLNASANSWGPRNELAYVQKFGCFAAQVVILLINTDDLFATAPSSLAVGRDRNYPDHKPALALIELVERYLRPVRPIPELAAVQAEPGDRVGFNLAAIATLQTLTTEQSARLILAMTPLLRELGTPGPRDYEIKARQRLQEFTQTHHIPYIDFLPIFNQHEAPAALYRDHIHLSSVGNRLVSDILATQV